MDKNKCRELVVKLIDESAACMKKHIDKVFNSGAIDVESAEDNLVLPKTILLALLKEEMFEYGMEGTRWEKQVKEDVENIYACL